MDGWMAKRVFEASALLIADRPVPVMLANPCNSSFLESLGICSLRACTVWFMRDPDLAQVTAPLCVSCSRLSPTKPKTNLWSLGDHACGSRAAAIRDPSHNPGQSGRNRRVDGRRTAPSHFLHVEARTSLTAPCLLPPCLLIISRLRWP